MPPKRQRKIRKRKLADDLDEEQDNEESASSIRERVETAKLLQRQRARPLGTDAASLAVQKDSLSSALERSAKPQSEMMEAFSKEQTREYGDAELDPNMQKYIDEQMEKRLGVRREENSARTKALNPEAELYVTPDELKIDPIKPAEVPGSWLTGIAEVPLPAHYKLQNIEETEAAKKRMLQSGGESDEDASDDLRRADQKLARGAFPRGFGREGDKARHVRTTNLMKYSGRPGAGQRPGSS